MGRGTIEGGLEGVVKDGVQNRACGRWGGSAVSVKVRGVDGSTWAWEDRPGNIYHQHARHLWCEAAAPPPRATEYARPVWSWVSREIRTHLKPEDQEERSPFRDLDGFEQGPG